MADQDKSPFEINDFSGGITDNIFSGETNRSLELDNFDLTPDKKILSRSGSEIDDETNSPILSGNTRIGTLINYARNDKLFVQSGRQFFYRNPATYSTAQGPSGNDVFSAGSTTSAVAYTEWNRQLFVTSDAYPNPMKIYKDGSGNYQVRNVGLPQLASNPVVTPSVVGANNHVYAFVYTYVYSVFGISFEEIGPTLWVTILNCSAPEVHFNQISSIPALTNAGGNNYQISGTGRVKIEIYRTLNNRTAFYKVGEVNNGTTTFNDTFSDATIQANDIQLYTNDGTLDYYPAPKSKFVHVVGNVGYWGYTSEADGEHPFRLRQSVPGNPGFVPLTTFIELEDELRGVKSVRNLPIVLCKKQIYRLDGVFDSAGRGGINAIKIHDSAGCVSHLSAIEAENFLYWAGVDGFYYTDGYEVHKITDHLNSRYKGILDEITQTNRIMGKHDLTNRRIHWTIQQDSANGDCDSLATLHLRWGQSNMMSFTTYSGGVSYRPTAIEFFNDYLYRADTRGFVFRHNPLVYTDPKIDTTKNPNVWNLETIIWNLTSLQFNFDGSFFRKFVSRILIQAGALSNTTIQISATNDQGRKVRNLKLITWRRILEWGDALLLWGNTFCVWNAEGTIEQWRRMPAKGLRLSYLQIQITNGFGIVENSDNGGTADFTLSALEAYNANGWPTDSVDYSLAFENSGYETKFVVSEISGDAKTLTLLDPLGQAPPDGTYKWELFGYKKGEPLNLLNYNLFWEHVDQNQGTFQAGDGGDNA